MRKVNLFPRLCPSTGMPRSMASSTLITMLGSLVVVDCAMSQCTNSLAAERAQR